MSRTKIKFCGNKSLQDYETTIASGVDYIGFVFAESKRQVKPEQVEKWIRHTSPGNKRLVGIFVNQSKEEIMHAVQTVPLDIVQCHGEESPEFIRDLKAECDAEIWKVMHHENETSVGKMEGFMGLIDGFVIDRKHGNQYGGTGTRFDWAHIPLYSDLSVRYGIPYFIAGGINVDTLGDLLPYAPPGIDLSSGIEENFIKSRKKMNLIESMVMEHDKRANAR